MAGKRYSAGAIFLQVVPVFANVQRAIEDEAKNIDRALGDQMEKSGERAGEKAGKAASKAMAAEVKKADIGKEMEKQLLDGVAGMDKALGNLNTKNLGKKLRAEVADMRSELQSLGDVDIKIDDNFDKVGARVAAVKAQIEDMRKRSKVFFDIKGLTEVYRGISDVQKAIDKVNGDIKLDVDTKPVERKMGAFEKKFKATTKRAAESLAGNVNKEVRKLADELKYLENLRIGVDISGNRARAELKEISADIERLQGEEIDIDAKVALTGAMTDLVAFEAALKKIDGEDVEVDVKVNGGGLNKVARDGEDAANSFRSFNIVLLAATSVGPALVPVLAAIAGGLLALGPAAAVGAFGIASVLIGFSGIGDALGALQSQQDAAATNAVTNAGRHSGAADTIRNAQEALADAERNAARAAEDAAERVADARRNAARAAEDAAERVADAREEAAEAIEDAIERQKDAQEEYRDAVEDVAEAEQNLRDARAEAAKDAADLATRQRQNAVDERQAVLDLFDAQTAYNAVMGDPGATATDRERASVDLEQAQIALNETRTEQVALADEAADYAENGVEGSEKVKDAQDVLTEALEAQKEAQEAVKEAAREADEARIDGAEAVSEALEDQREIMSDSARAISQALEDQAETQSDNARAIERAREALARARQGQDDLNESINAQQLAVDNAMGALGPAGRTFALYLFGLREEWQAFRDDLQTAMLPSVQTALEGFFASPNASKARDAMVVLAGAFGAFTIALSQSFQGPVWGAFFEMLAQTGPLIANAFGGAFIALFEAFASILTTLAPYSLQFGEGLERMMQAFANWADSEAGVTAIQDFMNYAKEIGPSVIAAFVALAGAVANLLIAMLPYSEGILEVITNLFNVIGDVAKGPLGAFVGALLATITASQIAYAVMNLLMAGGALLGSAIGALVFVMVGLAAAIYFVYRENETLGTILGVIAGSILAVVLAMKAWWAITKLVTAVQLGFAIATGASTAALTAQSTATKIAAGVAKAWMAVQIALNAVMSANPIALVILAIVALVAVLIYAWKNHEGFRDVVLAVWAKVKEGFAVAWAYLKVAMTALGELAVRLWKDYIKPAFEKIGEVIKTVWREIIKPVFKAWWETIQYLWKTVIKPTLPLIWKIFKTAFDLIKGYYTNILWPVLSLIGTVLWKLWNLTVKPVVKFMWEQFKTFAGVVRDVWQQWIKPALEALRDFIKDNVKPKFEEGVNSIKTLWEGLKSAFAGPIKFFIEKVINDGVVDGFNWVAKKVGSAEMKDVPVPEWTKAYATGGILPGYTPGRDPHKFVSPTGGRLELSGGEAVMRPEWTAAMGSGYVNQMNALAASGGVGAIRKAMGYATGGIIQSFAKGGRIMFPVPGGYVERTEYNLGHDGMDINHPNDASGRVPYFSATEGTVTYAGYARGYGNAVFVASPYGELVYGHSYDGSVRVGPGDRVIPGSHLANIGDTGNSSGAHLHFGFPGGTFGAAAALLAGSAMPNADNIVPEQPKSKMPSWAKTILGAPLDWAADLVRGPIDAIKDKFGSNDYVSMIGDTAKTIAKMVGGKIGDIIPGRGAFDAAGKFISKGADAVDGAIRGGLETAGDAIGLAKGGILPYNGAMMYDSGGYLPPGLTTVMNLTGKPEPVFTADQFDSMSVGTGEGFTYAPTFQGSNLTAADVVDDLDFNRRKVQREGRYGRSKHG